jgi:hypothetical protein
MENTDYKPTRGLNKQIMLDDLGISELAEKER